MPPADDLLEDIRQARAGEELAREQVNRLAPKIEEQSFSPSAVRFQVTKWVVGTFLIYAAVVGLFIMNKGESAQTTQLIDIMKTLLLPIVTLVIGFYFGSKAE
jgi:hypothetical protein